VKIQKLGAPRKRCYLVLVSILLVTLVASAANNLDKLLALAEARYGETGKSTLTQWKQLLETSKTKEEMTKLLDVNDFFNNKILFSTDHFIWGKSDYWATPLETMGRLQGDCEDFSIAKYITLLKLGIALEKLRLVYVKARINDGNNQAHMVLAYYPTPNADPLILDNLSIEIRPASKRPDLTPVFSFNSAGLWVGNAIAPKVKKPETRLSRWRDVLTRMQAEGLQ